MRRLAPVLLVLLGTGVGVALAEVFVRVADPHVRDHVLPSGFFVIDAKLGWRQRPDHTVTHHSRFFKVSYTTNARGYRDKARPDTKRDQRTRILLYGDSQVLGWGVPQGLRFSDLLETRHPELEVWNLAVMAYGLDQQLLDYEQRDQGLEADAVAFFVSSITLRRMETGSYARKHKPRFVLDRSGALQLVPIPRNATTWTTIVYSLFGRWYLPYFLERRLAVAGEMLRLTRAPADTRRSAKRVTLSALTRPVLARASAVARSRGHQLLLLTNLADPALQSLRQLCAEDGIRLVAVEFPDGPFIFSTSDPHWNQRGHERVADQFAQQWAMQAEEWAAPR